MEQEKLTYLTIFIYPPDEVILNIIALQNIIANRLYMTEGLFDNNLFKPHITLCSALFYKSEANILRKKILNEKFDQININLDNKVSNDRGLLFLHALSEENELKKIHMRFIGLYAKHRKGVLRDKYSGDLSSFLPDEKESIIKYGSPRYGKLYRPHVSVLQIEEEKVPEIQDVLDSWKVEDNFTLENVRLIEHSEEYFGNNSHSVIRVEDLV